MTPVCFFEAVHGAPEWFWMSEHVEAWSWQQVVTARVTCLDSQGFG